MTTPLTPETQPLAPLPAPAPARSAVSEASDRARAAIAAGQPLGPAPTPAPGAAPAAGQAPPAAQPAPVPAPAPAAAVPPAGETPEAKAAREAAAAAAAAPPAEETPEQIAEREAAEALTIELPVGETDEDNILLKVDDPAVAEQIRGLVEQAVEGRAAIEEVESMRATVGQMEEMREYADADPVGFTLDMLGQNLQAAKALTLFLLTQPSLYNAVKADLPKLADPKEFRLLAADAREQRHTMTEQANDRIETSRAVRVNLSEVQHTVHAMLPEELTPVQRQQVFRDCLRDLKDYADSKDLIVLPVHQIPGLLAARLSALGVDPDAAAARAAVAVARKGGPTPPSRALLPQLPQSPARTTPRVPAVPATKKDGQAFVASAARKRDAGAIPTAGAGAPSTGSGLQVPRSADGKKLGINATIEWYRAQRAKGIRSW